VGVGVIERVKVGVREVVGVGVIVPVGDEVGVEVGVVVGLEVGAVVGAVVGVAVGMFTVAELVTSAKIIGLVGTGLSTKRVLTRPNNTNKLKKNKRQLCIK